MGRIALFLLALAVAAPAPAQDRQPSAEMQKAGWTLITASEDVFVYMRVAERGETGLRRVWTAYDSAGPRQRDGFTFRSVRSLGEFDCRKNLSRVVEETYHDSPALSGKSWRSPSFIPTPWAKPSPGSVGAMRMAFACRALAET
jgi:hypothetical protein